MYTAKFLSGEITVKSIYDFRKSVSILCFMFYFFSIIAFFAPIIYEMYLSNINTITTIVLFLYGLVVARAVQTGDVNKIYKITLVNIFLFLGFFLSDFLLLLSVEDQIHNYLQMTALLIMIHYFAKNVSVTECKS